MKKRRTGRIAGPPFHSIQKKTLWSGTSTTTKKAIMAGSPIMGLPAFCKTIGRAWIMRLTHCSNRCRD
jgi:hypothetical protein